MHTHSFLLFCFQHKYQRNGVGFKFPFRPKLGWQKTVGFGSFDSWDHQQFSSIIQTHFQYNTISDSILLSNAIPSLEELSAMVYWNICSSQGYGTLPEMSEPGKPVSKHKQFYIQQGSIVKSNFTRVEYKLQYL